MPDIRISISRGEQLGFKGDSYRFLFDVYVSYAGENLTAFERSLPGHCLLEAEATRPLVLTWLNRWQLSEQDSRTPDWVKRAVHVNARRLVSGKVHEGSLRKTETMVLSSDSDTEFLNDPESYDFYEATDGFIIQTDPLPPLVQDDDEARQSHQQHTTDVSGGTSLFEPLAKTLTPQDAAGSPPVSSSGIGNGVGTGIGTRGIGSPGKEASQAQAAVDAPEEIRRLGDGEIRKLWEEFDLPEGDKWLRGYVEMVQRVQGASEEEFRTHAFQQDLWESSSLFNARRGARVDTTSAYGDQEIIGQLLLVRDLAREPDPQIRATKIGPEFDKILMNLRDRHTTQRPQAKLARVFIALAPRDMHSTVNKKARRILYRRILGRRNVGLMEGMFQVRERLRAILGEEKGFEDDGRRVIFCWGLAQARIDFKRLGNPSSDEEEDQKEEQNIEHPSGVHIAAHSDLAEGDDLLGFDKYVEGLTDFILNPKTGVPLSVSIEAEWGMGKSFFLGMVAKRIRKRSKFQDKNYLPARVVTFNPWRHDKRESVWAAFALTFIEQLANEIGWWRRLFANLQLRFQRAHHQAGLLGMLQQFSFLMILLAILFVLEASLFRIEFLIFSEHGCTWAEAMFFGVFYLILWNLGTIALILELQRSLVKDLISLSLYAVPMLAMLVVHGLLLFDGHSIEVKRTNLAFAALLGSLTVISALAKRLSRLIRNPFLKDLEKFEVGPDYHGRIGFVEEFHKDFTDIVECYVGKKERVAIIVEDLDRCEVPRAAELMQALNLMLPSEGPLVFLLAMDREKVATGITVRNEPVARYLHGYEGTPEAIQERLRFGQEYIEKFVQLGFRLPHPSDDGIERYIRKHAGAEPEKQFPRERSPMRNIGPELKDSRVEEPPSGLTKPVKKAFDEDPSGDALTDAFEQDIEERTSAQIAAEREAEDALFQNSKQLADLVIALAPAFGNNPRRVKHLINVLRLSTHIALKHQLIGKEFEWNPEWRNESSESYSPLLYFEAFGKLIALQVLCPKLLEDAKEYPRLLHALEDEAQGYRGEQNPQAQALVKDYPKDSYHKWRDRKGVLEIFRVGMEKGNLDNHPRYSLRFRDVSAILRVADSVAEE